MTSKTNIESITEVITRKPVFGIRVHFMISYIMSSYSVFAFYIDGDADGTMLFIDGKTLNDELDCLIAAIAAEGLSSSDRFDEENELSKLKDIGLLFIAPEPRDYSDDNAWDIEEVIRDEFELRLEIVQARKAVRDRAIRLFMKKYLPETQTDDIDGLLAAADNAERRVIQRYLSFGVDIPDYEQKVGLSNQGPTT